MKSCFQGFWLSGFLAAALALQPTPAHPASEDRLQVGESLRVVDGDTVRLGAERIRLIGLDAPELHGKCREEKRLAMRARDRLAELLATDDVEIIRSVRLDKYRRTLAIVRADGVDVARVLISEGLARPYHGERRRSWCEGRS
ncbi:nuclease [Kaistia algarum]|uniref:thermonuclease family protein n=1 Tax=Kaistia algarum TaxID=2083279 RepID=UPI000CE76D90|nr:thermonuclease family protein [Kaistia algarum]MCX5512260.1 thermonuclease family protein [Kaistia algarum]PPE80351.1 nuclease [Kaistia algarum]